ncbi:GntR family transcriptional regulator [Aureimonas fodinaquatilis]|uniref:GntR family transcriptional regulator n=1 Tax=Aureimonas fodinaquatilis TaxID=2565783 RepID=A0A5B0E3J6_9HYPH|nr:GntR family transcriptional regulator [Aureimonas fodinaquatilis]KAA0971979.1 GntR family transcriptional regulator [Aureimonas fodinaquatilis]
MDKAVLSKQSTSINHQVSIVERVYEQLKDLAIRFKLLPGDRVNEVELARQLGVSRTPLREALNRLVSEGFLIFVPGKGFFRRSLDVKEIFDLYEMRQALEMALAEMAVQRATPEKIQEIRDFLVVSMTEDPNRTVNDLVSLDEEFHERMASLSGNLEMLHTLRTINARIRFIRWVNMENGRRRQTQCEHEAILDAIANHDVEKARSLLQAHIDGRLEQITLAIREGYAMIYMNRSTGQ